MLGDIMGGWEMSRRSWRRWVDSAGWWYRVAVGGLGRWETWIRRGKWVDSGGWYGLVVGWRLVVCVSRRRGQDGGRWVVQAIGGMV